MSNWFRFAPLIALTIWILISAVFARPLYNFLTGLLGEAGVQFTILALFPVGAIIAGIVAWRLSRGIYWKRIVAVIVWFLCLLLYAVLLTPIASERMHLLYTGALGIFGMIAASRLAPNTAFLFAFFWCAIVAGLDEWVQSFVPGRVSDPRDVITGLMGGFWGCIAYQIFQRYPEQGVAVDVPQR